MRVGIGYDTHCLGDGGPLLIGGVKIPFERHLVGHSDADVLLHAITDAILGASALGDIGEMFPNTAPENRRRDSSEMLRFAHVQVKKRGFKIVNIDCIVLAQRPKMSAYKAQIQTRVAEILELENNQVGVKAKTGEGVGTVGREEVIAAQCVALLTELN